MKIFAIVLVILIISITLISFLLISKLNSEYKEKAKKTVKDIFKLRGFEVDLLYCTAKKLVIALNKQFNRVAIVENYDPDNPENSIYKEIKAQNIINIEHNGFTIKLNYRFHNQIDSLILTTLSKEAQQFFHELIEKILFKKLEAKYPDYKFEYFASSDWECSYIWAYDPIKVTFAYLSTIDKQYSQIINLRKEFFTIDTKYNYLEVFMMGQPLQLLIYEKEFIYNLYSELSQTIKQHITPAVQDRIYYDSYAEILYLTNGYSSLQSIIISRIEDVFYRDNRLQFTLADNKKVINFMADRDFIEEFENFVIGYNLRKIANSFNYKSDKLINANVNTKFIVDVTRDRMVYCANLNKFYAFSYMTIAFSNLESAEVIQNVSNNYVRIKTKDDEILDVTCLKPEVAQYIKAQVDYIINSD